MASISSVVSQTSSYEPFVQQLIQLESQTKLRMEIEQRDMKEQKSALGAVSSAISELESLMEELSNPDSKSFEPFSFSSTDESVVKVNSASGFERESDFNISIDRLAKSDVHLGQVRTGSATDLAAFGDGSVTITIGDKTETINVVTQKDDGSGVMIDLTNEEILQGFADQIENLFADEARASMFNVNSTDVQFSMQSLGTGFDNRIQVSGATGVLSEITGGTTRLTPEADLDAQFTIDGVTFQRSENTVTDAIEGLSFSLLKESATSETMSIRRDTETAKGKVDDFMEKFNELNSTIRERTFINPDTGNKGPLQGMRSVRTLSLNLRQSAILSIAGASENAISQFSDMGISFGNDGTMKIDDSSKLEDILMQRPEEMAVFFSSENSPIAQMKSQLLSFSQDNGVIDALETGVDAKLARLDKNIAKEEAHLLKYEDEQRRIFNELDSMLEAGQAQFDQVMASLNSLAF